MTSGVGEGAGKLKPGKRAPNIVTCVTYHVTVTDVTFSCQAHPSSCRFQVDSLRSEKPEYAKKFVFPGTVIEMLLITQCTADVIISDIIKLFECTKISKQ